MDYNAHYAASSFLCNRTVTQTQSLAEGAGVPGKMIRAELRSTYSFNTSLRTQPPLLGVSHPL